MMVKTLLIDDDAGIRRAMAHILSATGFQVAAASNSREGLNVLRADPADVVITDILLPEMDGLEAVTAIRNGFPETRIIAISTGSGRFPGDYLANARSLGAHDTLRKPFTGASLFEAVRTVSNSGCILRDSDPTRVP